MIVGRCGRDPHRSAQLSEREFTRLTGLECCDCGIQERFTQISVVIGLRLDGQRWRPHICLAILLAGQLNSLQAQCERCSYRSISNVPYARQGQHLSVILLDLTVETQEEDSCGCKRSPGIRDPQPSHSQACTSSTAACLLRMPRESRAQQSVGQA